LPLDVLLVFTANPEDYTARGKIITPPEGPHRKRDSHALPRRPLDQGIAITEQEAWTERVSPVEVRVPGYIPAGSWRCSRSLGARG